MKKGFTGFFLGLLLLCAASCALADVAIDEAHFPDERFRNYVHAHFDANFDWVLTTAEAAKADQVDLGYESDPKYTDLTGLEYLPALRYLQAGYAGVQRPETDESNYCGISDEIQRNDS